ncbi:P-loop containing nucleoside triphosphate hydrolase protein, partial [Cercophora newfieldiana]
LGMTGAGKTTFASLASGRTDLEIGNTLKSCTQETQVVRFELDDYTIVLVDTPGFDDDTRSDIDILRIITEGLSNKGLGSQQQRLDGLILLHPITSTRIGGNERKRTRLLEAILGEHAYKRVIIATTMWDDLRNDDNKFSYRMEGRTEKGEVWHEMSSKGATITRHYNNPESAHKIIRDIIQKSLAENGGVELQLQRELADGKGRMGRTTVGTQVRK